MEKVASGSDSNNHEANFKGSQVRKLMPGPVMNG